MVLGYGFDKFLSEADNVYDVWWDYERIGKLNF